ncbi:MAG: DNA primase [Clostridiales Family XIII bacterium]|jgi:DNA primase|nr:DNA primase [Clostridiales Family XIII bacterium]
MNIVDEIKNRCNIVDVIGRQVPLKKAGASYKGLCPFHNEKTPSFTVSEEKQRFTCYGCGVAGDVINFVQRTQNLSFLEAAEKLAEEYGIEWKRDAFDTEAKRSAYYEVNREAAAFFYRAFRSGRNPALAYMAGRGLDDAVLKRFGVGYADGAWDSLYTHLTDKGIDKKLLSELGLISSSNGKVYDKYRNRVMFPIINTRDKIIGFGGRVLDDGSPKYLNSSDSRVFKKKDNLYALNVTRQEIAKEDCAILCEGYMDVISLYRHGVRNVTASLGTALTSEQAAMLKRYTEHAVIAYDADQAGLSAAERGMDILRDAGCRVRVLQMTGAKDPDEYVKAYGREAFLELVRRALPLTEYKLSAARARCDLSSTEGSLAFLRLAATVLRDLSPVEAEVYIKKIAAEPRISEGAIRRETWGDGAQSPAATVRRATSAPAASRAEARAPAAKGPDEGGGSMLERNFIRLMLRNGAYADRIKPYDGIFSTPAVFRIYSVIAALCEGGGDPDMQKLEDALDRADRDLLRDICENVRLADKDEELFTECVNTVRLSALTDREHEIIRMLTVANDEEDRERIEALTKELINIQQEIRGVKGR